MQISTRRLAGPIAVLTLAIGISGVWSDLQAAEIESSVGRRIASFAGPDASGAMQSLDGLKTSRIVVAAFIGVECPMVNLYAERLAATAKKLQKDGVAFVGIYANHQDQPAEIQQHVKEFGIDFLVIRDADQKIADTFGAKRTPEIFILDADRVVRYHGRIDDQFSPGVPGARVQRNDMNIALEEMIAGKPVSVPTTPITGCYIGRLKEPSAQPAKVTYTEHIAAIFQKRCLECHRSGQIAPFELTTYADAASWADTIVEVVKNRRMPPWHASSKSLPFANDCHLSDDEIAKIEAWAAAGAPKGDAALEPAPLKYSDHWRIPEPDFVATMPVAFQAPATGEIPYQNYTVDPGFTEDRWIVAAEAQPGNRAIVHHIIVNVVAPKERRTLGGNKQFLVATAPGARPMILPEGSAKLIPAGSKLHFQMHYTTNGKPQSDQSRVGLVFAKPDTIRQSVVTVDIHNHRFKIPPGADNHRVDAKLALPMDCQLLSMFPHMHVRGKSFTYELVHADGRREMMLDIPRYDFSWQNAYMLEKPLNLKSGATIECVAHYDNSTANPSNPDPTSAVTWGDQTWEEMMIGYIDVMLPVGGMESTGQPAGSGDVLALAANSLRDADGFRALSTGLAQHMPKLDRMCVTTSEGGQLAIVYAEQRKSIPALPMRGFRRSAFGSILATYAGKTEEVFHEDLSKAKAFDMQFMGKTFATSFHVPVVVDGKPATLNFWSRSPKAFDDSAKALFRKVAESTTK